MGLLDFFRKKSTANQVKYDSTEIVEKLEQLGYFKFTSLDDLAEVKKELVTSLSRSNYLGFVSFDHSPYNSKDFRHYHFDGEDLFEEGGFSGSFKR